MNSYHDYVIKDGQFVGRFEQPCMQDRHPNPYARQAGIFYLKEFGIKSAVEHGSGLGYYAQEIYR